MGNMRINDIKTIEKRKFRKRLIFISLLVIISFCFIGTYFILNENIILIKTYLPSYLFNSNAHAEIINPDLNPNLIPNLTANNIGGYLNTSKGFKMDFAVQGNLGLTATPLTITTDSFNWITSQNGNVLTLSNQNSTLPINVSFNYLSNGNIKITHNIQNKFTSDISELKLWYYFIIPKDTTVRYNSNSFVPMIKDKITIKVPQTENLPLNYQILTIGENRIDFRDLIYNGYKITNFYYGNGSILNRPNDIIVALSVTDADGILSAQESLSLDPILSTTSFKHAGISVGNFTNSKNANVSDNVYATAISVGQYINLSNFKLLAEEGGNITNGSYIQGMDIQVEAKDDCFSGGISLNVSASGDNGNTWKVVRSEVNYGTTETYVTWENILPIPEAQTTGDSFVTWNTAELSNANFKVRVQLVSTCVGTTYIDDVKVNIGWLPPPITNITNDNLDEYNVQGNIIYRLGISDITSLINSSSVLSYVAFDWNDTQLTPSALPYFADYHYSSFNPIGVNSRPTINTTCLYGLCGWFNRSQDLQEMQHSRFDLNDSVTVNAWVMHKSNVAPALERTIVSYGNGDGVTAGQENPDWRLGIVKNPALQFRGGFLVTNNSGINPANDYVVACRGTANFPLNSWTMITGVKNATGLYYYENAVLINGTCPLTGSIKKSNKIYAYSQLQIGSSLNIAGSANFWNGAIDEVLVLNVALNQSQITSLYNNQTQRFFPRGELIFPNQNIGTNNTINISAQIVIPLGTSFNISIGNKSGSTYVYNPEIFYNSSAINQIANLNNINISTPDNTNFSIKYIFYSDSNQYLTPVLNETFSIFPYLISGADSCTYTSGNWEINCADNCVVSSNVVASSGSNLTITGNGNVTLNANVTGFSNTLFGDAGGICTVLQNRNYD